MGIRDYKLNIRENKNMLGLIALAIVFPILWVLASFTCAFFTTFLIACLIWRVEVKYPLYTALVLTCISSVIMAFKQYDAGDLIATWGFFFFAVGVTLAHLRLLRKPVED